MADNKWATGVTTPISGVKTILKIGRGPLCGKPLEKKNPFDVFITSQGNPPK